MKVENMAGGENKTENPSEMPTESSGPQSSGAATEKQLVIRRGRVDSLVLYEITDDELRTLEKGSPASLQLNFSIWLLSTATAFLIALLTTEIKEIRLFVVFAAITVGSFIGGTVLLGLWMRGRKEVGDLIVEIKKRVPPD